MPFIFQHGMEGDANQPLSYIGAAAPTPVISLNARGHSPSTDIDSATASFEVFADDVIALADHLRLARFIIGGISLGAGTALNLAIRYPDRVTALVLCRPAWLDRPQADFNRHTYTEIADLLDRYPADDAARRYRQTRMPTDQPSARPGPSRRHPARLRQRSSARGASTTPAATVHVHNDANAATIAAWQLGAGRGTRDFCYVTVSTGRAAASSATANSSPREHVARTRSGAMTWSRSLWHRGWWRRRSQCGH